MWLFAVALLRNATGAAPASKQVTLVATAAGDVFHTEASRGALTELS